MIRTAEEFELYVACGTRSVSIAWRFLDHFLPDRKPLADEYSFPEFSDAPRVRFKDPHDVMRELEQELNEGFALYWGRVGTGDPRQAMVVFTEDGGMIAGLVSARGDVPGLMRDVAHTVDGRFGLVALEERPPDTLGVFIEHCRRSGGVRLVDGVLVGEGE